MADYKALAKQIALEEGVNPELFGRLVQQESSYNPNARGPATRTGERAIGLTQLMPGTAKELGVDPTDPLANLRGGARYLKKQIADFGSDELGLAAYNAGPGNVRKYKGIPPFAETQHYVKKIMGTAGTAENTPNPVQELRASDNLIPATPPTPTITANMAADSYRVGGDKGRDSVLRLQAEGDARALREEIRPGVLEMINGVVMGATDHQILRGLEKRLFRDPYEKDPAYKPDMVALIGDIPNMDRDMVDELQLARNKKEEQDILARYQDEQSRLAVVGDRGAGVGIALSFVAELTQLSNVAPGLAAYKALSAAKMGSAALAAQGRTGAAITSSIGENVISGTAVEAVNQSLNGDFRPADLFMAAGIDSIFGVGFGVAGVRGASKAAAENAAAAHVTRMIEKEFKLAQRAEAELGAGATPEAVRQKVNEYHLTEAKSLTSENIADLPAGRKLMSNPEEALPESAGLQAEDVLSNDTRFSADREQLVATAGASQEVQYGKYRDLGLDLAEAVDGAGRRAAVNAIDATPGVHLHGDTKDSVVYKALADSMEKLRQQFIPNVSLQLTNGGTGISGNTLGGHQIIKSGTSLIALRPGAGVSTMIHEFGHAVFAHRLAQLSDVDKAGLKSSWDTWRQVYTDGGSKRAALLRSPIGAGQRPQPFTGDETFAAAAMQGKFPEALAEVWRRAYPNRADADRYARYFGNFDEYSAEQFSKFVESEVAGIGPGKLSVPQQVLRVIGNLIEQALDLFRTAKEDGLVRADANFEKFFTDLLDGNVAEGTPPLDGVMQKMAAPSRKLTQKQKDAENAALNGPAPKAKAKAAPATAAAPAASSGPTAADSVNQIMTDPDAIKYGVDSLPMSTPAERAMAKEVLALYKKAADFEVKHPMDEAYLKRVDNLADNSLFSVASTGLTMLKSKNPLVRMVAFELLEDASGASGVRQSTASISKFMHERLIQGNAINDVTKAYDAWKGANGLGLKDDFIGGANHDRFNKLVAEEIEARRKVDQGAVTTDANVAAAADSLEAAYQRAANAQRANKTLGWAALPPSSRGYMPHRMSGKKVWALTNQQRRVVQDALTDQFVTIEKWDMSFADELAAKYLERVRDRASGGFSAPMGGGSGAAAEIVEDALRSMNLTATEIREHMQRYTRGAANFTKSRIDLDLNRVYDVEGKPFKLMDVFETNQMNLLRAQSQRASGEIALARHGVYGKPGLDLLRKAMQLGEDGKKVQMKELEAFDQVSAEFLGSPYGTEGGKWMERAMAANGAARLGGIVFNQLSETINGIFHVGAGRAFDSITSIKRLREEIIALSKGEKVDNPFLTSIEASGGAEFGTDSYKMVMPFDSPDHAYPTYGRDSLTLTDRILRGASHAQSVFSGFRMVHSAQQRGMAEQIVHKMMRFVRDGGDDVALQQFGITPEIQKAMRADLNKIAQWDGDRLVSFDVTKISDPDVREAVIQSVHRGVRQIIQGTFIGETGKWAHDGWLKLLTQFRTFSITSMEKQWGRQRNSRGNMEALGMVVGSLAMAMPIYMARTYANSIGRPDQQEFLEQRLSPQMMARATMNYIAHVGLAGDFIDLVSATLPEELGVSPTGGRAGVASTFVGNYILPASSMVDDVWKYVQSPTDLKQAARILPGSRVPYLLPFVNALGD